MDSYGLSNVVRNLGEKDMGTSLTLIDFVNWVHREYNAQKYALIINYADYFVSTEESIPLSGLNYTGFINVLPNTDGASFAIKMVQNAGNAYTMSAINLSKINDLSGKIDRFAKLLITYENSYGHIIDYIRGLFNGSGINHEYGYNSTWRNHDYFLPI